MDYFFLSRTKKKGELVPHSKFKHSTNKLIKPTWIFLVGNHGSRIASGDGTLASTREFTIFLLLPLVNSKKKKKKSHIYGSSKTKISKYDMFANKITLMNFNKV